MKIANSKRRRNSLYRLPKCIKKLYFVPDGNLKIPVVRRRTCCKLTGGLFLAILIVFCLFKIFIPRSRCDHLALQNAHVNLTHTASVADLLILTKKQQIEAFRRGAESGNPLIDDYGQNDIRAAGELGRCVKLTVGKSEHDEQILYVDQITKMTGVNAVLSDWIPLNRLVPDSRIDG